MTPAVRLPLQVGRACHAQGARFAATVWLGPILLLSSVATFQADSLLLKWLGTPVVVLLSLFTMAAAMEAFDTVKRDRPSDLVLDGEGLAIIGGPTHGARYAWAEIDVASCEIVAGEARTAVRWLVLSWLTGRQVTAIVRRVRVPVYRLELPRVGAHDKPMLLAEAEGDERASLEQLRDSIRGAKAPATPPKLAQEILTCPSCNAAQVPVDAPTMTCPFCNHELAVPAELQQRMRARVELEQNSAPRAKLVRRLVDQPGAGRAAFVLTACRRGMIWIQPAAIIGLIVMIVHQTGHVIAAGSISIARLEPSDDYVFFYDIALWVGSIAAMFAIGWALGATYVSNRRALRLLADNFGAVPPAKPGEPSSCRQCSAPLPATTALLVRCVYCSADNVLGIDPRPAAMRHKGEQRDLSKALSYRWRARLRLLIVLPLCAALGVFVVRELGLAWRIPEHEDHPNCWGIRTCGTLTNDDGIRRAVTVHVGSATAHATVPAHGKLEIDCGYDECTIDAGTKSTTAQAQKFFTVRIHR